MNKFLHKATPPEGWSWDNGFSLPGCVVLTHAVYGMTTIDVKRRLYAPGFGTPNPSVCTMTYRGKGWEQCIVNDATSNNARYWGNS
jgi:hypothetical protein